MQLSPDEIVYWQLGFIKLNATIVFTWCLMLIFFISANVLAQALTHHDKRTRWQNALETIVLGIEKQISSVGLTYPRQYIGFLGTLFLFVALANLLTILPGYEPPTGSLSTTLSLALCVFIAVPYYGIKKRGVKDYLASYAKPTVIMLPFNIIGEISRTFALAVRLFGNIMSGTMVIAIMMLIAPFIFPIVMTALGLLTGMVQAYIFFILASVYIAAATSVNNTQSHIQKHTLKNTPLTKPSEEK
ncbi:F0F1 ATP synthase subunit A [Paraglaciecola sp. MB-3u-78]|uniref:F0F1 ATP synthase subunit A n=1 Tax=Paraglaciecola sp. MB-3u-78 TaxID=2058332 RepID=UPI000C32E1B5|nr:F0F1 ATP synthase subunit A [Paraglaciecola sp. MB-3u-78]PKG99599.1 F0F1 ATP synthase subunit A [Paraglaciecola sp. MB-3u-78]